MKTTKLTADRLRHLLDYDPLTGSFTWRYRVSQRILAGHFAGGPSKGDGRWRITVDKKKYLAHRLAWLHVYGEWPAGQIDHINGDGHTGNNRIAELRSVTSQVNTQNQTRARSDNKHSRLIGAHYDKQYGSWRSSIGHNGKQNYLGTFPTREAAHEAYVKAKRMLHEGCTI